MVLSWQFPQSLVSSPSTACGIIWHRFGNASPHITDGTTACYCLTAEAPRSRARRHPCAALQSANGSRLRDVDPPVYRLSPQSASDHFGSGGHLGVLDLARDKRARERVDAEPGA